MTVRILLGDAKARMAELPDESVHCIWTSVPYWGLRSYGTEPQVWGGDAACDHDWIDDTRIDARHLPEADPSPKQATNAGSLQRGVRPGDRCACSAWRGEHGLEPTLAMWLENEVAIWRELRRVLRKDGTAWLNCGDAYATSSNGRSAADTKAAGKDDRTFRDKPISTAVRPNKGNTGGDGANDVHGTTEWKKHGTGLVSKQRLMLPARLALALQADGWWLRDEIIWHKLNPMPSSVGDRTTPAHEMLYLLTRSARYYFDAAAIQEPMADSSVQRLSQPSIDQQKGGAKQDMYEAAGLNAKSGSRRPNEIVQGLAKRGKATAGDRAGRNKRSVWPLATEPFPGAHFATAPTELVKPCILAGCPKGGTVLDPFGGSGTTGLVADRLGRDAVLIELNPEYAEIARARIHGDGPMFADVQTSEAAA